MDTNNNYSQDLENLEKTIQNAIDVISKYKNENLALKQRMESLMQEMTALQRQILELRLQGFGVEETTQECRCSHRTVYRAMESAKTQLENRLSVRNVASDTPI